MRYVTVTHDTHEPASHGHAPTAGLKRVSGLTPGARADNRESSVVQSPKNPQIEKYGTRTYTLPRRAPRATSDPRFLAARSRRGNDSAHVSRTRHRTLCAAARAVLRACVIYISLFAINEKVRSRHSMGARCSFGPCSRRTRIRVSTLVCCSWAQ